MSTWIRLTALVLLLVTGARAPWAPNFSPAPFPAELTAGLNEEERRGATLFREEGCIYCHQMGGVGGVRGPDLTDLPLRLDRPLRAFYDGVHHYRGHPRLLAGVFAYTTVLQAVRVLSIWAAGKAVGIELGPRIYYVMGPLFFLVLLVPFTLNGIAVREAFFVSFLGSVGVPADTAFAAGFLFFLVTTLLALPGALILLVEGLRGGSRARVEHG